MPDYSEIDRLAAAIRGRSTSQRGFIDPKRARAAALKQYAPSRAELKRAEEQKAKSARDKLPWYKKALLGVMESPVGEVLKAVDLGRSYVASHVSDIAQQLEEGDVVEAVGALGRAVPIVGGITGEAFDAIEGKGFDVAGVLNSYENEKNRKDFWKHTGVGEYLHRGVKKHGLEDTALGNKWVARTIGFAGDVGLDPLTYLTGGIAGSAKSVADDIVTKGAARVAEEAAERAAREGLDEAAQIAAREAAITEAKSVAARVLQKGKSSLTPDEARLYFPDAKHGLHWTVPGTGRLGRKVFKSEHKTLPLLPKEMTDPITRALAVPRNAIGNSATAAKIGSKMGGRIPEIRSMLRSGEGTAVERGLGMDAMNRTESALEAAGLRLHPENSFKAVEGGEGGARLGLKAVDVYRKFVRPAMEDPEAAVRAVESATTEADLLATPGAKELRDFLKDLHETARREGIDVRELDNYFPRILTDEARAKFGYGAGDGRVKSFWERGRTLTPESKLAQENGLETNWQIRQFMNDVADADGLSKGFYEKNIDRTLEGYLGAMTKRVARQRGLKELERRGLLTDLQGLPSLELRQAMERARTKTLPAMRQKIASEIAGLTKSGKAAEASFQARLDDAVAAMNRGTGVGASVDARLAAALDDVRAAGADARTVADDLFADPEVGVAARGGATEPWLEPKSPPPTEARVPKPVEGNKGNLETGDFVFTPDEAVAFGAHSPDAIAEARRVRDRLYYDPKRVQRILNTVDTRTAEAYVLDLATEVERSVSLLKHVDDPVVNAAASKLSSTLDNLSDLSRPALLRKLGQEIEETISALHTVAVGGKEARVAMFLPETEMRAAVAAKMAERSFAADGQQVQSRLRALHDSLFDDPLRDAASMGNSDYAGYTEYLIKMQDAADQISRMNVPGLSEDVVQRAESAYSKFVNAQNDSQRFEAIMEAEALLSDLHTRAMGMTPEERLAGFVRSDQKMANAADGSGHMKNITHVIDLDPQYGFSEQEIARFSNQAEFLGHFAKTREAMDAGPLPVLLERIAVTESDESVRQAAQSLFDELNDSVGYASLAERASASADDAAYVATLDDAEMVLQDFFAKKFGPGWRERIAHPEVTNKYFRELPSGGADELLHPADGLQQVPVRQNELDAALEQFPMARGEGEALGNQLYRQDAMDEARSKVANLGFDTTRELRPNAGIATEDFVQRLREMGPEQANEYLKWFGVGNSGQTTADQFAQSLDAAVNAGELTFGEARVRMQAFSDGAARPAGYLEGAARNVSGLPESMARQLRDPENFRHLDPAAQNEAIQRASTFGTRLAEAIKNGDDLGPLRAEYVDIYESRVLNSDHDKMSAGRNVGSANAERQALKRMNAEEGAAGRQARADAYRGTDFAERLNSLEVGTTRAPRGRPKAGVYRPQSKVPLVKREGLAGALDELDAIAEPTAAELRQIGRGNDPIGQALDDVVSPSVAAAPAPEPVAQTVGDVLDPDRELQQIMDRLDSTGGRIPADEKAAMINRALEIQQAAQVRQQELLAQVPDAERALAGGTDVPPVVPESMTAGVAAPMGAENLPTPPVGRSGMPLPSRYQKWWGAGEMPATQADAIVDTVATVVKPNVRKAQAAKRTWFNAMSIAEQADLSAQTIDDALREGGDVLSAIDTAIADLESVPLKAPTSRQAKALASETRKRLEVTRSILGEREELVRAAQQETDETLRAALAMQATAKSIEAQIEAAGRGINSIDFWSERLKLTASQEQLASQLADQSLKVLQSNPKFAASRDVVEAVERFQKFSTPQGMRKFLKHWDEAVGYLKSWQLATPGFHVRNLLGGTINNFLADVEIGAGRKFMRDYKLWQQGKLAQAEGEKMAQLVEFLGGGQYSPAELGLHSSKTWKPWSRDFEPLRASSKVGNHVEFRLRGALGWDRMSKGMHVQEALADITKFHFDYANLSPFERNLKRVIPFYTWSRYNLPLQFEMILQSPGKYSRYQQMKQELEWGVEKDPLVPDYFINGMFGIRTPFTSGGSRVYLTPDIPFTQTIENSLPETSGFNPLRAKSYTGLADNYLSQVTPLIKLPLELREGKQFFKGIPIPQDYKNVDEPWGLNNSAGDALGSFVGGKQKAAYILEQMFPLYQRGRRYVPSEEKYKSRQFTSLASAFGIPIRTNTPYEQRVEKQRRDRERAQRNR